MRSTGAILWTLQIENNRVKLRAHAEGPGIELSRSAAPHPRTPDARAGADRSRMKSRCGGRWRQPAAAMPDAPVPVVTNPDPTAEISDAPVIMAAEPAASPAGGASHAIEAAYAAALRQNVDARTTVPTSAEYRLMKPSGETQIRFVLDRLGNASEVVVARSSGSHLLDRQALNIVATGRSPLSRGRLSGRDSPRFPSHHRVPTMNYEFYHQLTFDALYACVAISIFIIIERGLYLAYLSLRSGRVRRIIDGDAQGGKTR